jgi:hypothetical protein
MNKKGRSGKSEKSRKKGEGKSDWNRPERK